MMLLNCGVGEDSWDSLGLQGDPTSPSWRRSVLGVHLKDWYWSWNSNNLANWYEELTHLKRPWCWERLKAGGEGDDRGWNGWMASLIQWTWVWVNSGSSWWTGRPNVLQSMGLQSRTRLNWKNWHISSSQFYVKIFRFEKWYIIQSTKILCSNVFSFTFLQPAVAHKHDMSAKGHPPIL